ncbi:MAG: dihydrofolate reductase [Bacteroidales bacterium]
MKNLSMIAAVGNNGELGYQNQLLCHLPVDLKRFKKITSGCTVLMGDKTWESLPKKPLPNRRNIVITLNREACYLNCEMAYSIEEAMALLDPEEEAFIIGGATIYKLFIDRVQMLYITRILSDFQADVFFPTIDSKTWELTEDQFVPKDEHNEYDLRFQIYELKKI